jgi:wyosine [tRNA(Phe)-imidazoG37] synthetase (radical SAM superfamily)
MVRSITDLPVAVITNGSLLGAGKMGRELASADAVLPSLDACSEMLFRRINRPHPSLRFDAFVEGLERFRGEFAGRLWVEVMLVQGLNDGDRALTEIAAIIDRIQPDEVHLSVPTRPPAESWVAPPGEEALQRAADILGIGARVLLPVDVAASPEAHDDLIATVQAVVSRHPLREAELVALLERWRPGQTAIALARLRESGRFQVVDRLGESFWCSREGVYSPAVAARPSGRGADQAC